MCLWTWTACFAGCALNWNNFNKFEFHINMLFWLKALFCQLCGLQHFLEYLTSDHQWTTQFIPLCVYFLFWGYCVCVTRSSLISIILQYGSLYFSSPCKGSVGGLGGLSFNQCHDHGAWSSRVHGISTWGFICRSILNQGSCRILAGMVPLLCSLFKPGHWCSQCACGADQDEVWQGIDHSGCHWFPVWQWRASGDHPTSNQALQGPWQRHCRGPEQCFPSSATIHCHTTYKGYIWGWVLGRLWSEGRGAWAWNYFVLCVCLVVTWLISSIVGLAWDIICRTWFSEFGLHEAKSSVELLFCRLHAQQHACVCVCVCVFMFIYNLNNI